MATKETTVESSMEPLVGLYTMFYRKDTNHLQSKNFRFNGNLKEARARAEQHANIMGMRLNFVQPLISDLSREEHFKTTGQFVKEEDN